MKEIIFANSSGFWGDSSYALSSILNSKEKIDYLVSDYLSEVTMGLLKLRSSKNLEGQFIKEFLDQYAPLLEEVHNRGIKIITNAGGLNPDLLADQLMMILKEKSVDLKVMAISAPVENEDTHVYLGAFPIADALSRGADIVVTGRVVDSALTLGPLIHEFNWTVDQFNELASGSIAGHLIECGTQVCGGNFSDWQTIDKFENISYPFLSFYEDLSFKIKLGQSFDGVVNRLNVLEQLLYETENPQQYILPDVSCDYSSIDIIESDNTVTIKGVQGSAPPPTYKALKAAINGHKISCPLVFAGEHIEQKAQKVFEGILKRLVDKESIEIKNYKINILGKPSAAHPYSVALLTAFHDDIKALKKLACEIAPSALSMAPGIVSMLGGRPKPSTRIDLESLYIHKKDIDIYIYEPVSKENYQFKSLYSTFQFKEVEKSIIDFDEDTPLKEMKGQLIDFAVARSGDKGSDVNIGVVLRKKEDFNSLKIILTEELIRKVFPHIGDIDIFPIPKLGALNIFLRGALGGGGLSSLDIDSQGKGYAQRLLYTFLNEDEESAK